MKKWHTTIRVDKNITPKHFSTRTPVGLYMGENYFVSFGGNRVTPCKLIDIENNGNHITIEIVCKRTLKGGFYAKEKHSLYSDEIGLTPEQAVIHQVSM